MKVELSKPAELPHFKVTPETPLDVAFLVAMGPPGEFSPALKPGDTIHIPAMVKHYISKVKHD